ncbi:hypothetical protein [Rhizobium tubonense]|uniref:Uncharacterized protein n=1 Tax=Rhizobium tubonense TaxID=484088 RepID=A0A2W4E6C7_9HYPH|nr:hypothetical protein [Rhizobium tubonense]PZM10996.1 hypothetical protein CPY51_21665 [Rhizobium tubonense]
MLELLALFAKLITSMLDKIGTTAQRALNRHLRLVPATVAALSLIAGGAQAGARTPHHTPGLPAWH